MKKIMTTKTLLIDANNLLKIGIEGVKDFYHNGEHIGGLFHFLDKIRKLIEEYNFNKVVVFWDGINSASSRKKIYPQYKETRKEVDEQKINSYNRQKTKVKQYLEEIFIRQIEIEDNEADDLIAYYVQISEDENKMIYSGDKDLMQLIGVNVSLFSPSSKKFYKNGDKVKLYNYEFPHSNIRTLKILSGDKSDNIDGIYYLGEKTLVKLFPDLLENTLSISDILTRAEEMLKEDKDNNSLKNLLTGRTKSGIYGDEFFKINQQIIDLSNPLITEEGKQIVELYYKETLDPENRNYKTLMKKMNEDGLFKFLPKRDNAWVDFIRPFLKLTRKEKTNFNNQKRR